jgi:stress-induced morphogen|tara:strand:- start:452 stop:691 length:240 start_codon:yes stop_codon:yes gene_type:complete
MPMQAHEIEALIKQALPDADITIEDLAGDGDHYAAHVKSSAFKGLTRIKQHRLVYDALQGSMDSALHALALQTSVKEEE